ncbi:GNAT family N-acetyltransferase [Nonomuraea sp. NPDC000554]|uniref:GNAT family N-acetyltransferase n=1 Tax=Nonomuraea sp. NPDC000554 TaxID=3154259 RepID=UPI00332336BA
MTVLQRVTLRELHEMADLEQVIALFDRIWRPRPGGEPITLEMLRVLTHTGNYVAGAYEGGRLVGASVGFLSAPIGDALHSHVTGAERGRGIGLALKLHQREWALERGLSRITWTYDPLVRRNAQFNLAKLGARPEAYLPSFYGVMADAVNEGDESDRLLTVWRLTGPAAPPPEVPADVVIGLGEQDGWPVPGRTDAAMVLVAVPADIEGLRRRDPATARRWRLAVREVVGGLLNDGARVTGFHHRSWYVIEKEAP